MFLFFGDIDNSNDNFDDIGKQFDNNQVQLCPWSLYEILSDWFWTNLRQEFDF